MRRATTPTHSFTLSGISADTITELMVIYQQGGENIVVKEYDDCTISGNAISVTLTQQETNKFSKGDVYIQLRVLTTEGKALASEIFKEPVEQVLDDEVMGEVTEDDTDG